MCLIVNQRFTGLSFPYASLLVINPEGFPDVSYPLMISKVNTV